MTEVLLYHHIQGLTDGVRAFAEDLRRDGHTVHAPDLFDGKTFATIDEGFSYAEEAGFDELRDRGMAVAEGLGPELVYAGLSFGVMIAQQLAQTRPGARGALLMHSCVPVSEFGRFWPQDVPVQIHGMDEDEFFAEDLPAARELAGSTPMAELFVYRGDRHLFTDSSLEAFDDDAASLLRERVHSFLGRL